MADRDCLSSTISRLENDNDQRRHNARSPARHVVVIGHPVPGSFNQAIADRYCQSVRAAGAGGTDPRPLRAGFRPPPAGQSISEDHMAMSADVARELGILREADAIVFVYPIWFGMPPAIIKGYVDRVMRAGMTPAAISHDIRDSILAGKRFGTFSTSATSSVWLDEHEADGSGQKGLRPVSHRQCSA